MLNQKSLKEENNKEEGKRKAKRQLQENMYTKSISLKKIIDL